MGGNVTIGQPNFVIDPATNHITNSGYTYDAAGNLTHDANDAYTYDGANRLTKVDAGPPTYTYFGPLRIKKVVGATTTTYIYSGAKPIPEYVGTNNPSLSKEYIYVKREQSSVSPRPAGPCERPLLAGLSGAAGDFDI